MRILIVDDELRLARLLKAVLEQEQAGTVDVAGSAAEALEHIRAGHRVDLVVTDLRMPEMSGLDLLAELRRRSPGTDVILMTAFAEVETAREALKRGALDYLVKPFDNDELVALVRQARDRRMVIGARSAPHAAPGEGSESEDHFAGLVGTSTVMIEVFRRIERAARSEAAVLVLGESGTGKELAARAIHSMSTRHRAPFVEVDCVAIPAQLLESELFGHERGAFTGAVERRRGRIEMSSGGTVFLDEIGEMPLEMQPKLLRFLQERQFFRVGGNQRVSVDVRVIAATNRDLRAEVAAKRFRDDLFHRLDVFPIEIPPLRERASDIPLLVHHFMNRSGGRPEQIDNEVLEVMMDYSWPGNVRELQNAVTHALIDAAGQPITLDKLPEKILEGRQAPASASEHSIDTLDLAENERWLIEQALREGQGNKTKAAVLLGITRRRLYSRMKLLGMDAGAEPADAD